MSRKRSLDAFFVSAASSKKAKREELLSSLGDLPVSTHPTYPFPIPHLPSQISDGLGFAPASEGRVINDQLDLDLVYYQPYIPNEIEHELFEFLRSSLPFYRVQYKIKRGPTEVQINTPRYTVNPSPSRVLVVAAEIRLQTVFGIDESSVFDQTDNTKVLERICKAPVARDKYKCKPRPLPACLEALRRIAEGTTGELFNFCLVNYYASGNDSISYHSDDERFLGPNPAIASLSLGAERDFLMKHKPVPPSASDPNPAQNSAKPIRLPLASGDMILMRAKTQGCWLHSIPKRKLNKDEVGRINITFRKAMVRGGTENYYHYNVGTRPVYKWDDQNQEMRLWKEEPKVKV